MRETRALAKQIELLQSKLDNNKKLIQEYFDKKRINAIQVNAEAENTGSGKVLVAMKRERANIEYNIAKLKERLPSHILQKALIKNYIITDIDRLKAMLKACGASAKEFKECIRVEEKANKKQLSQLYSMGDITLEDLQGCYEAEVIKYITIEEREKGD